MSLGLKLRLVRNAASPMPCGRYSLTPLLRGQARVPSGLQHSHDRSQRMQVLCMVSAVASGLPSPCGLAPGRSRHLPSRAALDAGGLPLHQAIVFS